MTRERLPSPGIVKNDMDRVRLVASDLEHLAEVTWHCYEELYEASLSVGTAGDGIQAGKASVRHVNDPTFDAAISGRNARMRRHARRVASKLRRIIPVLEEAESMVATAFAETDPDFAEKLRRLREIEEQTG